MSILRRVKNRVHGWAFELNLIRRVHNISRYWASGEIRKQSFFDGTVRALVLSPHPDDESIGCGGTIGLMKAAGATVDVLFMTSGEAGHPEPPKAELAKAFLEQRKKEAASACGVLGVDNIFFLEGRDGELNLQASLAMPLARQIDLGKYDVIFCPWPYDSHSDHEATYRLFRAAMLKCVESIKQVWLYEVWNPLHANRIVNIDETIEKKCEALSNYHSQVAQNDLPAKVRGLAQYRSIHLPNANHAEAFMVLDGDDLALLP